jgi:hypothetical protein
MATGSNCGEKSFHGCADRLETSDRRGIAKAKLCIRREETQESCCVAGINDRKQAPPPRAIRLKDIVWYDGHAQSIRDAMTERLSKGR